MNWYYFIKLADIEEALQRVNAQPNVVQFISDIQDPNLKNLASRIVFSVKGLIELDELKNRLQQRGRKTKQYQLKPQEQEVVNSYSNSKDFQNWIQTQILNSKGKLDLSRVSHIWDWYEKTNQNLSGFTYEKALNAADQWSQTEQSKTSTEYQPLQQKDIFMKFPDGMMFVKLSNEHDTSVEGNLMNHCVGNYCEDVVEEKIYVYSLRTPNNEPVVTLGFDRDLFYAKQIKGKSDVNPIKWKNRITVLLQKLNIKYYDSSSESNGSSYGLINLNEIDLNLPENKKIKDLMMKKVINNVRLPSFAFAYFIKLMKKKDPEIMKYVTINSQLSYYYAENILRGRFELGEEAIAKDTVYSYYYAKNIIRGRFELGEKAIAKDAYYSYDYALSVLNRKRFELGEEAIAKDARYSCYYAMDILNENRFELGEETIAKNAHYSYYYAENILKGERFELGEKAIAKDSFYLRNYIIFLQKNNIEVPEIFKQYL